MKFKTIIITVCLLVALCGHAFAQADAETEAETEVDVGRSDFPLIRTIGGWGSLAFLIGGGALAGQAQDEVKVLVLV